MKTHGPKVNGPRLAKYVHLQYPEDMFKDMDNVKKVIKDGRWFNHIRFAIEELADSNDDRYAVRGSSRKNSHLIRSLFNENSTVEVVYTGAGDNITFYVYVDCPSPSGIPMKLLAEIVRRSLVMGHVTVTYNMVQEAIFLILEDRGIIPVPKELDVETDPTLMSIKKLEEEVYGGE